VHLADVDVALARRQSQVSGDMSEQEHVMWPIMHDLSISGLQADALFASRLQRCDEPSAGQVRQAIATAVREFGYPGCAARVAQEFGDHPETAVIRMRWARAVAGAAFADSAPEPGPRPEAGRLLVVLPRLPSEQVTGSPGAGRRERAWSLAGGDD
jgi:hypothetical protein